MDLHRADAVDRTIGERQTLRALAGSPLPVTDRREVVETLLAAAGWAPFHRPAAPDHRNVLPSPVPWRGYALDAAACRSLRDTLGGDAGKVHGTLAAADALVLVTWLPDPPAGLDPPPGAFEPSLANMEHIAAASAAVQNLLLAATARGLPTFWSSGGVLRSPEVFDRLGIPRAEILLAAIYLFPPDAPTTGSKLRAQRGDPSTWSRWVAPASTARATPDAA